MALHTAMAHLLLGAGVFLARPDHGVMRLVLSPRAAGATARRLLPVAVLAPVVLGYLPLRIAAEGQLSLTAAVSLLIIAFIGIFAGTILWRIAGVDKIDAERQRLQLAGRLAAEQGKADKRLRSLLESAPDATVVSDPSGRIVHVNAQTGELFGYAREEMLGQPVEMLIPERLRASHAGHRAAYYQTPQARPMGSGIDLTGRRKDGSEFPVEVSLSPVETDDGMLVCAAIRDSSARRQRESGLIKARGEAKGAQHHLETLIKATPLGIIEVDCSGLVCSLNPASERMFGWRAEEVMG
jgi:PAS domain S-box-containing protein